MGILSDLWPLIIPILIYGGSLAIIIYLIVRRVKEKKNETFEKRDN